MLLAFGLGSGIAHSQQQTNNNENSNNNDVASPTAQVELNPAMSCAVQKVEFVAPDMPDKTIVVKSKMATIVRGQLAKFEQGVSIASNKSLITADKANITNAGEQINASGSVQYTDQMLQVNSESVDINGRDNSLRMQKTDYKLASVNGRGGASALSISESEGVTLEDVSFTTCPLGSDDWRIQASEISIERDKPVGQAYNTRFYIGDVPIFYLPYFAFPLTTERQTGFLFPRFGSSSSTGLEWEQPFYWNIAPNMDATISPRIMTKRGTQLKIEYRYLYNNNSGELQLEYLPNDRKSSSDNRYFYRYVHRGKLADNWTIAADVSGLSDDNYIIDLGSDYYSQADTHLYRQVGVNYFSDSLDFTLAVRDFTTIGNNPNNYRTLPQANLAYSTSISDYLELNLDSEVTYFENDDAQLPDALRVHIAPFFSAPYQRAWGELLAEVGVLHTQYKQDLKGQVNGLSENVSRTLGQARLYGSLIFDKQQTVFQKQYTWTIEPKAQYLYTGYEDQSNIALYDSTPLLTNFSNLFRGQEFTGLDRINDNNQIAIGATTRLINEDDSDVLTASIAQIIYLKNARLIDTNREENRSAIVTEIDWQVNQNWFLHSDLQVGNQSTKIERSSVSAEYRLTPDKFVQLNHRYIRNLSNERIDQVGLTASWPIAKNWHWVGRHYRDLERSRSIESFIGLEYESCCWSVRFSYKRNLAARYSNDGLRDLNEYDSGFALQIIFKGMGSAKRKVDMLDQGLFGHQQPFSLY